MTVEMAAHRPTIVPLFISGNVSTGEKLIWHAPVSGRVYAVEGSVGTAPASTAILVDVEINGTSVFAATGDRLTVADGATEGVAGTIGGEGKFAAGDRISIDVDQIGTGTTGANLAACLVVVLDY